ncbi:Protein of unknown function [Pyronema omphalodes CBS 100304]|uniref:Uncharacterized protein n=1 Tax=Pyronema omphalodes (strain CBS 100304) TaxID=1076935 RepID=U4KXG5_PYROM|nr:Protein of unknown function [Pyronema omphalodes CBS 100304]
MITIQISKYLTIYVPFLGRWIDMLLVVFHAGKIAHQKLSLLEISQTSLKANIVVIFNQIQST